MKLAVIGGGGVRSAFLARSIARRAATAGIHSVTFMDTDKEKLRIFGGISKQVAFALDPSLDFSLTDSLEKAVEGADYIITTIRVGGDASRALDERFTLDLGILGQETTGACGFLMATRTIPALFSVCEAVQRLAAPGAIIFNFSNPAGLVVQALYDKGYRNIYGVCDAPSGFLRQIARLYDHPVEDFEALCFGLNHLSFFKSLKLEGRELIPSLLRDDRLYSATDMRFFEPALAVRNGMLLNEYLYYYYYRDRAVSNIAGSGPCRGEHIEKCNREMLRALAPLDPEKDFEAALTVFNRWYGERERNYMAKETGGQAKTQEFVFDIHEKDEGGYAGVALAYIDAMTGGKPVEMILNLPNEGAIDFLADDDVVELSCVIDRGGIRKKKVEDVRLPDSELIRRVKMYERMSAQAIIGRDEELATEALFLHPLVASYPLAQKIARRALGNGPKV